MKVTDKQIMDAFWLATLKRIRACCVTHYIGGDRGLNDAREFSMHYATYVSSPSFQNTVKVELSKGQLKKRIDSLIEKGDIVLLDRPLNGSYNARLPDKVCWPPYLFALEFMASKGLTKEPKHIPSIKQYQDELEVAMLEKFGAELPEGVASEQVNR